MKLNKKEIQYLIWSIRRELSRFFYKKWFITISTENGQIRTHEIDPEKESINIRNIKRLLK